METLLVRPTASRSRTGWRLVLAAALFVLFVPAGHIDSVDAGSRLLQAQAFLRACVDIPAELVGPDVRSDPSGYGLQVQLDGTYVSKYGIGMPLVWMLPTLVGRVAAGATGRPEAVLAGFLITFVNPVVILATVASLGFLIRRIGLGGERVTQVLFLLGTMALPYAGSCWSEPFVALLVLWAFGLPLVAPSSGGAFGSGVAISAASLVRPDMVLLGVPIGLAWLMGRGGDIQRIRQALWFGSGTALGPLWILGANYLVRGSVLAFSYGGESFLFQPPLPGLLGLLFSGEKSVFLYNPGLLVAGLFWCGSFLPEPFRRIRPAVAIATIGLLVFYASWHSWDGGVSHGPRLLFVLFPLLVLPAGPALVGLASGPARRAAAVLVALTLAASLPLQLAGLLVSDHQRYVLKPSLGELPAWRVKLRLLELKLRRGPGAPEVYRKSEFVALGPGEVDEVFDHRRNRTFQYLHQWMSLALAMRTSREDRPAGARR